MAARKSDFTFLAVFAGILVHIIYLASIFDIYFTSPLVHGMKPHKSTLDPPARRLVLFVADGLRADKFYELDEQGVTRAPFLRKMIENKGCWGVSHTRVPTESRPGHVALIAGFYEDVSAIAKGWKENPVEFDSTFNESRYTWAWGSPDILPMFAKGATGDHVFTSMYPAGEEDFADKDASKLDSWVFDQVKHFFTGAKQNQPLMQKLSNGHIIFFLHLLGIDTNGHAHRPASQEYLKNIVFVDNGISTVVNLIEEFYGHDGRTAYVLTSDHGMTNWGSHGAGHAHETLTPLVSWGAGVRGPVSSNSGDYNVDELTSTWRLGHLKRADVNQADIAPLMTSLIGVPYPLNSVGILPTDYLNNTAHFIAENMFTNAQQILAQYQVKEHFRRETSLFFRPFKALAGAQQVGIVRDIKTYLRTEKYSEASILSQQLMALALQGLNYYQNYDRVFLNCVVTLGFLGWIACIVLWIVQQHTNILQQAAKLTKSIYQPFHQNKSITVLFIGLGALEIVILAYQSAPLMYYIYCLLPLLFWNHISKELHVVKAIWDFVLAQDIIKQLSCTLIFGLFSIEILVLSFFRREVLCIGLIGFSLWALFTKLFTACKASVISWMIAAAALAVFPILPVVGHDANYSLVMLAGILTLASFGGILWYSCKVSVVIKEEVQRSSRVLIFQVFIICCSLYIVNSTSLSLKSKQGVPLLNQASSWVILVSSFIVPLFSSRYLVLRLISIALGFMSVYLLMSTAYEGLFLLALSLQMAAWLLCEHKLSGGTLESLLVIQMGADQSNSMSKPAWKILTEGLNPSVTRSLTLEDLRCSYFFVFFIITAFFGTGNIASINSFDPASVYCFLTVFSPFRMGALLLCKVIIPFVIVTCSFDAIHLILQVPVHSLFVVVLILTDLMGLHFFYLVKDHGSWLEIGTSISHYVIMMSFIIFLLMIFGLARILMGTSVGLMVGKKQI